MRPKLLCLLIAGIFVAGSCTKTATSESEAMPAPPSVDAGPGQTTKLPADSVKLSGSAKAQNPITGYSWTQVSGPNTAFIADDGAAATMVRGLITGSYLFQLMAVDSAGQTGVDTVSVTVTGGPKTVILTTAFPGTSYTPYELLILANTNQPITHDVTPELLAETWTINGITVYGHSYFKFNMSPIPQGAIIKSATLMLFSDTIPQNADLVHANYGSTNDFWVQRVSNSWDQSINFNSQPSIDTAGQLHVPQTNLPFMNLNLDVTSMVSNMMTKGNNGFSIRLNTEQIYNSRIFCSSRYSDSARRPYMVVSYE